MTNNETANSSTGGVCGAYEATVRVVCNNGSVHGRPRAGTEGTTMNTKTMTEAELTTIETAAQAEIARLNALIAEQQTVGAAVARERADRLNALRRCNTPEEFAAKGFVFECDFRDYSEGGEYRKRLKAGLPTTAPKFKVGEWAYNPIAKENARVVHVSWDGIGRNWRYSLPGYSTPDLSGAHESAPNIEYAPDKNGYCWHRVDGQGYGSGPVAAAQAEQLIAGEGPVAEAFLEALASDTPGRTGRPWSSNPTLIDPNQPSQRRRD